ncbi:DUF6314 family protein [Vreelandella sp. EE22]
MRFSSTPGPRSLTGWQGAGEGRVEVEACPKGVRFFETGTFTLADQTAPMSITNVFRWTISEKHVALAHERRGFESAVHLFDLHPLDEYRWLSREGHQCAADLYTAHLHLLEQGFDLQWRITGPKKDEWLQYCYRE